MWISPTIFAGFPLRWYGVMYLVAFGVTFVLFRHESSRRGLAANRDQIADFFFWTIFGLLAGGRIFHVAVIDPDLVYLRQPWTIVWPFQDGKFTGIQGMSYHGGFIGAVIAASVYARIHKLNILEWGDTLAVSAPLGYTFGRLGNFINGELTGRVTTLRWGMIFPTARRFAASEDWVSSFAERVGVPVYDPAQMINLPRHPSQLYEAALEGFVLWLVLWCVFRKRSMFRGTLVALYTLGYGAARFMAGYFRDPIGSAGSVLRQASGAGFHPGTNAPALSGGQLVSIAMMAAGVAALVIFRLMYKTPPTVETFER